jgi:diphthamide biosynthesis protein 7
MEIGHSTEELTLDVVEFCPCDKHGYPGVFGVVGAYDLNPESCERQGSLALFRVKSGQDQAEEEEQQANNKRIEWLWRRRDGLAGVLDFKWCVPALAGSAVGAAAQADAQVSLWRLSETHQDSLELECTARTTFDESPQSLALSLDWSNKVVQQADPAVVASYSSGHLCVWRCAPSELVCDQHWQAHSLEAWIAAYDHWNPHVIYSGGDDCVLKAWDLRVSGGSPIFTKRHDMGVTTVQSHPLREYTLATGSYDEVVSIWDKRLMSGRANPVAQRGTEGGGVWRIKWHPHDPHLFALAAMHRGFFVMEWSGGNNVDERLHYTGYHQSLAYGVDWSYQTGATGTSLLGSCSFYDKVFSLWQVNKHG